MKITRKYFYLLTVIVVVITVSATNLYAQQRMRKGFDGPGFMHRGGGFMGGIDLMGRSNNPMHLFRMAEELEMTKVQRDSIAKIMDDTRPKVRDNMFKMMDARKEMRELMQEGGEVSDRKLRSLSKVQGDSMAEMMYLQMKMRSDLRDVLTEEQLAKVDSYRDRSRRFRGNRFSDRQSRRDHFRKNWRDQQEQDKPEE